MTLGEDYKRSQALVNEFYGKQLENIAARVATDVYSFGSSFVLNEYEENTLKIKAIPVPDVFFNAIKSLFPTITDKSTNSTMRWVG